MISLRRQCSTRIVLLLGLAVLAGSAEAASEERDAFLLEGEFWRKQAVHDLMPLWQRHVRDTEHGAFHLSLSRDWKPQAPWHKIPAMISRQVFGFTAAFMLSGDERYLQTAREGVDYLMTKAWDRENGDWFDQLAQSGEPQLTTKTASYGLYTNVGLTLYYSATGDRQVLDRVMTSVRLWKQKAYDPVHGGYFQAFDREFNVIHSGKNKHAHYGYVGSLLLNLFLATRDPEVLNYSRELSQITLDRMRDDRGWVGGFGSQYDREWRFEPKIVSEQEMVPVGAQLTAALSLLRLYTQTGEANWLHEGRSLSRALIEAAFDPRTGAWRDWIAKTPPHAAGEPALLSWWTQIYGSFLHLHLYRLTAEDEFLQQFRRSESFFIRHMIDREFGGVLPAVQTDGTPARKQDKAGPWHTSYHEIEHALLNYLHLGLYVEKRPVVLHYRIKRGGQNHSCALVDDPHARITSVKVNGAPWDRFDARERSVDVPPGENIRLEVVFKRVVSTD